MASLLHAPRIAGQAALGNLYTVCYGGRHYPYYAGSLVALSACEGEPDSPPGASGGRENAGPTLDGLWCEVYDEELEVVSTDCRMGSAGVTILARQAYDEDEQSDLLLQVSFDGTSPSKQQTSDLGYPSLVRLGPWKCFQRASSAHSPDPCEIALIALDRGAWDMSGTGGAQTAIGSRVRMRVSCPDGLYVPGADDVSPRVVPLSPSDFELEARDCTGVGE